MKKPSGLNSKDSYHGIQVADPFRALEDLASQGTQTWLAHKQSELTAYFSAQKSRRDAIEKRLIDLVNYEKCGVPFHRGSRYFYFKNAGLQNQSVLVTMDALDAPERTLLDLNTLCTDGSLSLGGLRLSKDVRYLAYAISKFGSDWLEWRVRDVETGKDLEDSLQGSRCSVVSWKHDNTGFFYVAHDLKQLPSGEEPSQAKIFFHRIGTPQDHDLLIYTTKEHEKTSLIAKVSEDGKYLLIISHLGADDRNRIDILNLTGGGGKLEPLVKDFSHHYVFIGSQGAKFWFRTNEGAPNGRLLELDATNPDQIERREIIGESEHEIIKRVSIIDQKIILTTLKHAFACVKVYDLSGHFLHEAPLPSLGSVDGFDGLRLHEETYFSFSGFSTPQTTYVYNVRQNSVRVFKPLKLKFNPDSFVTKQVFVKSLDGTKVPLFVSHLKDLKITDETPAYLYGYGGFGFAHSPSFSTQNLAFMEMGGVFALANVRGGSEYGENWHIAGMGRNKQNSFNDFIASASWLIDNKYTSPKKLAIGGRSNGALMVAACLVQRPELFGAALAAVGVYDMIRFPKFSVGWAWIPEYGDPENPDDFKNLLNYSPLHNVKDAVYPPTMISTSDHDDRVVPAHSYKFAAALEEKQKGSAPVFLRVETKSGHGRGKSTSKFIEEIADFLTFLSDKLGM